MLREKFRKNLYGLHFLPFSCLPFNFSFKFKQIFYSGGKDCTRHGIQFLYDLKLYLLIFRQISCHLTKLILNLKYSVNLIIKVQRHKVQRHSLLKKVMIFFY